MFYDVLGAMSIFGDMAGAISDFWTWTFRISGLGDSKLTEKDRPIHFWQAIYKMTAFLVLRRIFLTFLVKTAKMT